MLIRERTYIPFEDAVGQRAALPCESGDQQAHGQVCCVDRHETARFWRKSKFIPNLSMTTVGLDGEETLRGQRCIISHVPCHTTFILSCTILKTRDHAVAHKSSMSQQPKSMDSHAFVRSILGQTVVCTMTDGRKITGIFLCIDRLCVHSNLIAIV